MKIDLNREKETFTLDVNGENNHVELGMKICKSLAAEISSIPILKLMGFSRNNSIQLMRKLNKEIDLNFRVVAFAEWETSKFTVIMSCDKNHLPESELK